MWFERVGPTAIANALGHGYTKDAVRKKALRDNWPVMQIDARPTREYRQDPQRVEFLSGNREPKPMRLDGKPITMANCKDAHCQWIAGEPGAKAQMCGHPVFRKRWCRYHFVRAGGVV